MGNLQPEIDNQEHIWLNGKAAKRVAPVDGYGNFISGPPTAQTNPSGTINPVTVGFDTTFTQTKLISGTTYTRTCTLNSLTGVFTYSTWI